MQAVDLPCNHSIDHCRPDPSIMSDPYSPIDSQNPDNGKTHIGCENSVKNNGGNSSSVAVRRERPSRACTQRAAARLQAAAEAEAAMAERDRKRKKAKRREKLAARLVKEESEEEYEEEDGHEEEVNEDEDGSSRLQYSRTITPLLGEPEDSQLQRWNIRSMWQLASLLDFLNVFRPLLNVNVEFSAEELETALLTPNNTLADIHIPLLKAIPPVTRMALGHPTWITVLCRKLRDWWHWVAEGDLPIVASHGTEVEAYNALDPEVRVMILKALCDIRVQQEDIRNYIDESIKHGVQLSAFRKQRLGGDSYGVSYWYQDDPIIGHRLYREIRKVEVKKGKGRNIPPIPRSSYQWEAVATNLDEFQNVSEKLFSSKNRTEVSVGKKLKNDMLPEIEKIHTKKEKQLKKQHRQALMLDNMLNMDGLAAGRSLRDRKRVTYTFDDYDRSINEALKATKNKKSSPGPFDGRDRLVKREISTNGGSNGPSYYYPQSASFSALSPISTGDDELHDDQKSQTLDRRQRPQRYSATEFVEAVSDNEADFYSDDDIVGEVVYNDEYLRQRKQRRKMSSGSEADEEYKWDQENPEEEEENSILSSSDKSDDEPRSRLKIKKLTGRTRREKMKSRSVDELQSGLRRSKRSTRNRMDFRQYEMFSESDYEQMKPEKSNAALDKRLYSSNNKEFPTGSRNSDWEMSNGEIDANQPMVDENQIDLPGEIKHRDDDEEEVEGVKERHFLDLNELAPVSGFEDGPNTMRDDEDRDDF
ncbi:hypothetical protein PHJA_000139600 [Phtheirospermum japonicum]|uniref:DDT domain-containing protein DDR4 n=1 Tax=Phtheirospermum japonicum TaxID=374723 RepID=A0A830B360_9LAMI|nr:hypothetical protein PHJA_000139600 [Phtheirospermum japonicum]